MATITYKSSTTIARANPITLSAPTRAAGDLLFLIAGARGDSTPSTPSGWTELVTDFPTGSGAEVIYGRIATNDTNDDLSSVSIFSVLTTHSMICAEGDIPASIGDLVYQTASTKAFNTSYTIPAITPSAANSFLVYGARKDKSSTQDGDTSTAWPDSYTESDFYTSTGNVWVDSHGYQTRSTATSGGDITMSGGTWNERWVGIVVAVNPVESGIAIPTGPLYGNDGSQI